MSFYVSNLQHVIPHIPNPTMDPTLQENTMMYMMQEEV
jgi:hypothetical protein